jgi:hypothetical protein
MFYWFQLGVGKEPVLFTTHAAYGQEIHRMQLDSDAPGSRAMPWCSHANIKECKLRDFLSDLECTTISQNVRRKDIQQLVDNSQRGRFASQISVTSECPNICLSIVLIGFLFVEFRKVL